MLLWLVYLASALAFYLLTTKLTRAGLRSEFGVSSRDLATIAKRIYCKKATPRLGSVRSCSLLFNGRPALARIQPVGVPTDLSTWLYGSNQPIGGF